MGSRKKNDDMDGLAEAFQDGMTEGDGNTALSSILPIVNPAQVRAKAPRASLPNGSSNGTRGKQKELDEYTVETNRPIDSVYIYPSAPQSVTSHRQRRQYRPGGRYSNGGGSTSGSSGGSGFASGNASGGGGSVGGILESLGLNGSSIPDDSGHADESLLRSTVGSNSTGMSYPPVSPHAYKRRGRRNGNGSGGGVQTRAALVLFGMMAVLYVGFQSLAMAKVNRQNQMAAAARNGGVRKSKHRNRSYKAFDEGEDRPMAKEILGKIKDPTKTSAAATAKSSSSTSAKTTTSSNSDGKSSALAVDKSDLPNLDQDTSSKADAPGDTLESIDQQAHAEATSLSLAVESGLSSIYSKDPVHKDIPFLWYIPRSGGGMVKNILSNCMELTVASEVGATATKNASDPVRFCIHCSTQ